MEKSYKNFLVCIIVVSLCGCTAQKSTFNNKKIVKENTAVQTEQPVMNESENVSVEEIVQEKNDGTDTELGLRNIRIHDTDDLTEQQKKVAQYFNMNYMRLNGNYEFLQRYPDVFKGAEIKLNGTVKKVLSSDSKNYELLVWVGPNFETFYKCYADATEDFYNDYMEKTKGNLIVIKGSQSEMRFMEGDEIAIRGTYEDVKDYSVDGTSYHVPEISVNNAYIDDLFDDPIMYDVDFIRDVATAIFGEDIEVRQGQFEESLDELDEVYWKQMLNGWYYVCELDNQSNSKFTKYYFLTQ